MRHGSPMPGSIRPAVIVVVTVAVLALSTALVLFVAPGSDDEPARPSTTTGAPTTTSTVAVERQVSLVADGESGTLFEAAGVEITAAQLRDVGPDSPIPEEFPVAIDPDFVAAQEGADPSLARLRQQVQFVANRLGPAISETGLDPALVVVARPRLDGGTLNAAVLVVNAPETARRLDFFDLRIVDASGSPITERVRFLESTGGVELPATTAYFNLVAFSEAQVTAADADLTTYSWEADIRWTEALR